MISLSKSQRDKRSQYLDLRNRGYSHAQAEQEVILTDEMIDRARLTRRQGAGKVQA